MGELATREFKIADIPLVQANRSTILQMRRLLEKGFRIPAQTHKFRSQAKLPVGVGKGLKQPDAKKTRCSGNKKSPSPQCFPKWTRLLQHMPKVFFGEWRERIHKDGMEGNKGMMPENKSNAGVFAFHLLHLFYPCERQF